jgi:hypothetical protein
MEMFLLLMPIQRRLRLLRDAYKAHPATANASWDRESNELAELYLQADIVDVICAPLPLRLDEPDPHLADVDFRPGIDKYLADADMRAEVRRYVLSEMLPAGADLDSATAFFECTLCKKVLHAPAAQAHQCYRYHLPAGSSPPLNLLLDDYGFRLPWYYKKSLVHAADAAEIGAQLVQMSGRDPSSTTLGDMEVGPVRYRCHHPPSKRRWPLGIPYADCTVSTPRLGLMCMFSLYSRSHIVFTEIMN